MTPPQENHNDIALIGMALHFPGANTKDEYWHNLVNGVESIVSFPTWAPDKCIQSKAVSKGAPLHIDSNSFDRQFFGLSAKDASLLDPQHRLFMQCAWHALEDSGIVPGHLENAGLFAGCMLSNNPNIKGKNANDPSGITSPFEVQITNDKDYLATRTAFHLGLGGPVFTVQSACSTGLVAVVQAIDALRAKRCEVALAGASTIRTPENDGYYVWHESLYSSDGHCRPFCRNASGTVFGSGVGVVVLKRMEDAIKSKDRVIAIVKGGAVCNDGAQKVGFSTTSLAGQKRVIKSALLDAQVSVANYRAVETHGAGTAVGDPIEFKALKSIFEKSPTNLGQCDIGAVKANVGHLENTAGLAGFIKAALQIQHGWITPQINIDEPLSEIDLTCTRLGFSKSAKGWSNTDPRNLIGVSSFGIGGTNAHVILQRPSTFSADRTALTPDGPSSFIPVSAGNEKSWHKLAVQYRTTLSNNDKHLVAYNAQTRRKSLPCRGVIDSESGRLVTPPTLVSRGRVPVIFQFPGQGSHFAMMAKQLAETHPKFNRFVNNQIDLLESEVGSKVHSYIFNDQLICKDVGVEIIHPSLMVVELAMVDYLASIGVLPDYVLGHSLGEIAAAATAGYISNRDALNFATKRSEVIAELPGGRMLAAEISPQEAERYLSDSINLAAVNSQQFCIFSGDFDPIDGLEAVLKNADVPTMSVTSTHAFHSHMMKKGSSAFEQHVPKTLPAGGATKFISTAYGKVVEREDLTPDYWSDQVSKTVWYAEAVKTLNEHQKVVFIEIGPGSTLTTYALQERARAKKTTSALRTLSREDEARSDGEIYEQSLAKLWVSGSDIKWSSMWSESLQHIELPLYPFAVDGSSQPSVSKKNNNSSDQSDSVGRSVASVWESVLGEQAETPHTSFFDMGGNSLLAISLLAQIKNRLKVEIPLSGFLEYPTISGLSEIARKTLTESQYKKTVEHNPNET